MYPLDSHTGLRHNCPNSAFARKEHAAKQGLVTDESLVLEAISYIRDLNLKLKTCQIRIVREPMT